VPVLNQACRLSDCLRALLCGQCGGLMAGPLQPILGALVAVCIIMSVDRLCQGAVVCMATCALHVPFAA
jgi:hypothetical protein